MEIDEERIRLKEKLDYLKKEEDEFIVQIISDYLERNGGKNFNTYSSTQ